MRKIWIVIFFFLFTIKVGHCNSKSKSEKIKFHTQFNYCPKNKLGPFVISLVNIFESQKSLYKIKTLLDQNASQYYFSKYSVKKDTMAKTIHFNFECPVPLFKINILEEGKKGEQDVIQPQNAILVDSGQVLSTTPYNYEEELLMEKKIDEPLGYLSIERDLLEEEEIRKDIGKLVSSMPGHLLKNLSECIFKKSGPILIFSYQNRPIELYFNIDNWKQTFPLGVLRLAELINQDKKISKMYLMEKNKVIVRLKKMPL